MNTKCVQLNKDIARGVPRSARTALESNEASVRLDLVRGFSGLSTRLWCRFGGCALPGGVTSLAASSFFSPHAATNLRLPFRDRLNPHPCLQRCRFQVPRYTKRPDVALCAIDLCPLSLLPTPPWQPSFAHSDDRSQPHKSSRAQACPNALAFRLLKSTVADYHPVGWSFALCPND